MIIQTTEPGKKTIKEAWETLRRMGEIPDDAVVISRALLAEAYKFVFYYQAISDNPILEAEVQALLPRIKRILWT